MSRGPRKKFDFFNGGRGIDLTETPKVSYEHHHHSNNHNQHQYTKTHHQNNDHNYHRFNHPESAYEGIEHDHYNVSGSSSSTTMANLPPSLGPSNSTTDPHDTEDLPRAPTTIPGKPTDTGYELGVLRESQIPNLTYTPQGVVEDPVARVPVAPPTSDLSSPARDVITVKRKKQRCQLCANHGNYEEMKGHKWNCQYRHRHDCDKCETTCNKRYFSAKYQKMTRQQQQIQPPLENTTETNYQVSNQDTIIKQPSIAEISGDPLHTEKYPITEEVLEITKLDISGLVRDVNALFKTIKKSRYYIPPKAKKP